MDLVMRRGAFKISIDVNLGILDTGYWNF